MKKNKYKTYRKYISVVSEFNKNLEEKCLMKYERINPIIDNKCLSNKSINPFAVGNTLVFG